jgi:hypothetical protein
MPAGQLGQANNRVLLDLFQPPGLAHAVAFLHVLEDGDHFLVRHVRAIENRALGFDKALLAARAVEQAILPLAHAIAHLQIAQAANAKIHATAILTAEKTQILGRINRLLLVLHDLIPTEPRECVVNKPWRTRILPWKRMMQIQRGTTAALIWPNP